MNFQKVSDNQKSRQCSAKKKTKDDEGDRVLYQISYQNAGMINNQPVK